MSRPDSTPPVPAATRSALLDAAESLLGELGVHGTSLRAITQRAGANLAAVNYHFGSKENLVRSVLARRLGPLNAERMAGLEAAESAADGAPTTEDIVRAFVTPGLRMIHSAPGGLAFARFLVRAFADRGDDVRELLIAEFAEVGERFTAALAAALPHLPRPELSWRFHFTIGSMAFGAGLGCLAHDISRGACDPEDVDRIIEELVRFTVAGLEAPSTGNAR